MANIFICVLRVKHYMKAQTTAINQDGDAGEFSLQGACATPVNAIAGATKGHASPFGHTLEDSMADAHGRYAAGRGQDDRHPNACTMDQSMEVGKR